ncbi:hypothetical protein Tco_0046889 [Tanacetum coccineum]
MSSSTLLLMSWTPSLQDDTKGYRKGHEGSTKKNGVQHDYNEHLAHQGSYLQGLDYGNPQVNFLMRSVTRYRRHKLRKFTYMKHVYYFCASMECSANSMAILIVEMEEILLRPNQWKVYGIRPDFEVFWNKWEGKENKGVDFYCTDFKLEFVIFQNDATRNGSILSYEVYRGCLGKDGHIMANLEMVTDSEDGGTTGKLML